MEPHNHGLFKTNSVPLPFVSDCNQATFSPPTSCSSFFHRDIAHTLTTSAKRPRATFSRLFLHADYTSTKAGELCSTGLLRAEAVSLGVKTTTTVAAAAACVSLADKLFPRQIFVANLAVLLESKKGISLVLIKRGVQGRIIT